MKKIIFLLSGMCLGVSLAAQDSLDIFHQHLQLNEVIVTGLTGDSRMKETPAPVSVIAPNELRDKASTNIIDAIAGKPGVSQITTGSGISKPVIRGLGYNRIIVLNDGIRQEGQQWGDEHGIEIDGNSVHSAEILKGPASLLYGSDALAGVVIFHGAPLPAPGTLTGGVTSEYQTNNGLAAYSVSHGGNRGGVVWNLRFSDKYAHAYRNALDGLVPGSQFSERSAGGMVGLNRRWGYSRLTLGYFHLTPGIVEGEREDDGTLEGGTGYGKSLPFQQIHHYKAVSDNTFLLGDGRLKVLAGLQQNRRQEFEESASEAGLDFKLNTLNYDIKYLLEPAGGWKLAVGVGGMLQRSSNLGDEFLIPAYRLADAGGVVTAGRTLGPVHLSGGLRYDLRWLDSEALEGRFTGFSRRYGGFTGSIGAVWNITGALNLRANLARGFRAPNLSELASNGIHEGTLRYEVGNPDLQPEFSLQGDVGMDFSSKYLSLTAALFYNRIDHYIFARRTGDVREGRPVYRYEAAGAVLKGGEAEIDIHPVHRLHFSNAFSYVYGAAGKDCLPMMPAPRWKSELKYEFTHDGQLLNNAYAALRLDHCFAQNRFLADTETATPAYTLLGAGIGTDICIRGRRRASVSLLADNLTDAVYQDHLSRLKYTDENPVTGRRGIFNMGRNFTIKLEIPLL